MNLVNEAQVQFGRNIGLSLKGKTVGVARAMIEDAIDRHFYGRNDLGTPTQKQIDLSRKFGKDIATASRRVGDAIINDIMTQLNLAAIPSLKGRWVGFHGTREAANRIPFAQSQRHLEQCTRSVVDEQLAVTDVSGEHGVRGVAGLRPNLERRDAGLRRACCKPRP